MTSDFHIKFNAMKINVSYWRASLSEVGLLHPEVPETSKPIEVVSLGDVWQIKVRDQSIEAWTNAQFLQSKYVREQSNTIPFVLIGGRLSEKSSHGIKHRAEDASKGYSILCIPCLLDRRGKLIPDPDRHPWIPRELLEPSLKTPTIGHLDDYDGFYSSIPIKPVSLKDSLNAASKLFGVVTSATLPLLPIVDEAFPIYSLEGYELVSEWHGVPYDPPVIARHLIKLYDAIHDDDIKLPLLDSLISLKKKARRSPLSIESAKSAYTNCLGHINKDYPLSPSQRESMVELVTLKPGQILSVNGPPGTGKTTLLQSVIAQMWIEAALGEKECPLIVVASTNVKAVENVLESFAKICDEIGHKRWHPYGGGFGLFLASETRESQHPSCTLNGSQPFSEHESIEGLEEAEKYYLKSASDYYEVTQLSIEEVVANIHDEMRLKQKNLKAIISTRYEIYNATGQTLQDGAESSCNKLINELIEVQKEQALVITSMTQKILELDQEMAQEIKNHALLMDEVKHAELMWNAYISKSSIWLDLFLFIPAVRRKRNARDRQQLLANRLTESLNDRSEMPADHFKKIGIHTNENHKVIVGKLLESQEIYLQIGLEAGARKKRAFEEQVKIHTLLVRWGAALGENYSQQKNISLINLNDWLDLAVRAPIFRLCDHYWTGKWLLEIRTKIVSNESDTKGRAKLEKKYRRFAKLSPCLVSNFHIAPAFFTAWQGEDMPFWNAIDLLIVDEAGQVSPDVGASLFALAKKALVVGDVNQIEPVWNVGESTDRANATKYGIIPSPHDSTYDEIARGGYSAASGSLMRIANESCLIQKYEDVAGLMLTEHRRCVPEIIAYCNKLIYSGRLEPKRPSIPNEDRILPALGYMNIAGTDRKLGSSRQNLVEARAIVRWLKVNRSIIEQHYPDKGGIPTPLWKLVGVVTPFASQARAIEKAIREEIPEFARKGSKLTIGTVHALQGAEREIVIFAPTYGATYSGGMMFDRAPNMLNVAVSRSKDSFIVMGNCELFNPLKPGRPSGLLGRFLQFGSSVAQDIGLGGSNASLL